MHPIHPLMLVPIGAGLVLVADLIGNLITFKHPVTNAVATSIVWCVLFAALVFVVSQLFPGMRIWPEPEPEQRTFLKWAVGGVAFAFIADLIGNYIAFDNPIVNAIITGIVWGVLFFVFLWIVGY